jgi:apolipoprotein a
MYLAIFHSIKFAWYYTTDKDTRWALCDVEFCGDLCDYCTIYECGSRDVHQQDYRGRINQTASGKVCLPWAATNVTLERYSEAGLEENFCRNPTGEDRTWCYHTLDYEIGWDYCNVPNCGIKIRPEMAHCGTREAEQTDYRGTQSYTISGRTCQNWALQHPHMHGNQPVERPYANLEENYCRNPDNEGMNVLVVFLVSSKPRDVWTLKILQCARMFPDAAWCYTTDPDRRWEFCGIPFSDDLLSSRHNATCGTAAEQQTDFRETCQ